MVAFYDIKEDIYAKARQQANDSIAGASSEEEDNDPDRDEAPADKDKELELDIDIDLDSPFLRSILSDERPTLEFRGFTSPVVATHTEMNNREPTEEDWSNM